MVLCRSKEQGSLLDWTPVSFSNLLFRFSLVGCMAREYFPRKRYPHKLADVSLPTDSVVFKHFPLECGLL